MQESVRNGAQGAVVHSMQVEESMHQVWGDLLKEITSSASTKSSTVNWEHFKAVILLIIIIYDTAHREYSLKWIQDYIKSMVHNNILFKKLENHLPTLYANLTLNMW